MGEDDHLIGVGQYRSVDFRAAYYQTVRAFLNDAYVIIWMRLLRRSQAAVSFHVSLRHRHRQIVLRTMLIKLSYPAEVIGVQGLIHTSCHHMQSKQRIAADFFDEHDQGPSQTGRRFDELAAFQQVIAAAEIENTD